MIVALKIVVVLVVVLLVVGIVLRVRKLRRDDMRELSKPLDRRLVAPPPSPYAPSKGFRLLDETGEPLVRAPVERPRLDPERHYVFSDSAPHSEDVLSSHARHDDNWFLSRSSHRSGFSVMLRRLVVIVLIGLVIAVIATYYVNHNSPKSPKTKASTSTSTTSPHHPSDSTATLALPSSFTAASTSGDDATYAIPASSYVVSVSGARGATWAVYNMGPSNTLEWQGSVAKGHVESLTMRGNSRITIGSPSNAAVSVENVPVTFPAHLPPTLVLVLNAATTSTTSTSSTTG